MLKVEWWPTSWQFHGKTQPSSDSSLSFNMMLNTATALPPIPMWIMHAQSAIVSKQIRAAAVVGRVLHSTTWYRALFCTKSFSFSLLVGEREWVHPHGFWKQFPELAGRQHYLPPNTRCQFEYSLFVSRLRTLSLKSRETLFGRLPHRQVAGDKRKGTITVTINWTRINHVQGRPNRVILSCLITITCPYMGMLCSIIRVCAEFPFTSDTEPGQRSHIYLSLIIHRIIWVCVTWTELIESVRNSACRRWNAVNTTPSSGKGHVVKMRACDWLVVSSWRSYWSLLQTDGSAVIIQ